MHILFSLGLFHLLFYMITCNENDDRENRWKLQCKQRRLNSSYDHDADDDDDDRII